jgi:hypothetical protein
LSDKDEARKGGQHDISAEEEEESEMANERDSHLHKEDREKHLTGVCTLAGDAFVEERQKRTDEVTSGDDT